MPLVSFSEDEWYPVHSYHMGERYGGVTEVPQDTLDRWEAIGKYFATAQNEMFQYSQKAEREFERIERMPKQWWSIVVRTPGSYQRHGFYGKEIDIPAHIESLKEVRKVEFYRAMESHAREYQLAKDAAQTEHSQECNVRSNSTKGSLQCDCGLLDPDGNPKGPDFGDGPEFKGWNQRRSK